ncbi:alpha/beta hydrolase [Pseudomaricurvus alkylphenolicus]|uniref:alpha/beta fold hydrolase n=1 Tax=Pseudomaricurvus alkylphenolicus TaxID=1306991 RepID=UPI00142293C2|nr:alpha/beta fold hydrolase [Pseudomaricurvus alkylphenolicus]NIB38468.1 alpha/beta hydrolase [Pseudomaricurvus alkylphenolicus]
MRTFALSVVTKLSALALVLIGQVSAAQAPQLPDQARPGQFSGFTPCAQQQVYGAKTRPAECGTLVVAENREKPNGRLIALPVVRLPAASPDGRDPIIRLSGGPGGTNLHHPIQSMDLLSRYDVLMLGYRGVDNQQSLSCPEIKRAALLPNPLSPQARAGVAEATRACAARLNGQGIDLTRYRMVDVIEDYEVLRRALGHQRFNLFSSSYGTRVAQYYSRLYPTSVARSVQVAVNPPGRFQWSPKINHDIMVEYGKLCAQDRFCSSRTDNLTDDVLAVLNRNDLRWNGKMIDMDRVLVAAFIMLMSTDRSVQFFDVVLDARDGDTEGLYKLAGVYDQMVNHTVWGDLYSKGGVDFVDVNIEEFQRNRRTTRHRLGSPLGLIYSSGITSWPLQPAPEGFDRAVVDSTETLLINGNLDMSTPLQPIAAELLEFLPNGHLVALKHFGHGDIRSPRLADQLGRQITAFYDDGSVRDDAIKFREINFNTGAGR